MKIEMGESLFYSWLRHVKECQLVQTNWKPSPTWQLHNAEALERFMLKSNEHFADKYGFDIYKKNSLTQLIQQAEADSIGIALSDSGTYIYAIDVAYHESGLNYGSKRDTVGRVIKKFLRTAMCIQGYFNTTHGELIFGSPKIHNAVLEDLNPCITDLNNLFIENGLDFSARVIANDDFNDHVLQPILIASAGVSDTAELFLRSYQLVKMFETERPVRRAPSVSSATPEDISTDTLSELKIGKIAQTLLRGALERGAVDNSEVQLMQDKDYSKKIFGIDFPLLVLANAKYNPKRYYSKPLEIRGTQYRLCSQWYETPANNDRPFLLRWLESHSDRPD